MFSSTVEREWERKEERWEGRLLIFPLLYIFSLERDQHFPGENYVGAGKESIMKAQMEFSSLNEKNDNFR